MGGWVGSVQVPRGLGKEENGGGWEAGKGGVKVGHKTSTCLEGNPDGLAWFPRGQ